MDNSTSSEVFYSFLKPALLVTHTHTDRKELDEEQLQDSAGAGKDDLKRYFSEML